jgi:hypothetical protein
MRPGCDRPAGARLAFDPVALQLWLDPLGPRSSPVQELCEFHIERLTIPRGWSATDRRPGPSVLGIEVVAPERLVAEVVVPEPSVVPEVAVPVAEAVVPEPSVVPVPEVVVPVPEPTPELVPEPLDPVAAERPAERPAKRPAKRPVRRSTAARAETPLLSRAFAWTGPQQSILTQGRTDVAEPDDGDDA